MREVSDGDKRRNWNAAGRWHKTSRRGVNPPRIEKVTGFIKTPKRNPAYLSLYLYLSISPTLASKPFDTRMGGCEHE